MHYCLTDTEIIIGAKNNTEQALNLHLLSDPLFQTQQLVDGAEVLSAFFDITPTLDTTERMIKLVDLLVINIADKLINYSKTMPFLWLLPESFTESLYLTSFINCLTQRLPHLFAHQDSQLLPFGRAALPLALQSVETLLSKHTLTGVCLIAVDSLFHQIENLAEKQQLVSADSEQGLVPSEGIIFTCIKPSKSGICSHINQLETSASNEREQAITTLFKQINRQKAKINCLYMPDNGNGHLQSFWLNCYQTLADSLTNNVIIRQTALFTGELGAVTGLYNFIHIYYAYQNKEIKDQVLHFEMADDLYQSISLYSWQ